MRNSIFVFMLLGLICFTAYKLPVMSDTVKGKMYFSDKPFTVNNTGSKKIFKSSE